MSFDNRIFEAAQERLAKRRSDNKHVEDLRRIEIHGKIPEYCELERSLADTMSDIFSAIANKTENLEEIIRKAMSDNMEIQKKMGDKLERRGYPRDYLDPVYSCRKCRDKGTADGKWCECFSRLLNTVAAEELNAHSPLKLSTFESFDVNYYSDKETVSRSSGKTQREVMKNNYRECVNFAEDFNGKGMGLLMVGGTGLGKTHLSLAAANRVIERGFCVIYDSAPEILRRIDKEQFGRADGDTMQLIMDCDLLILDDLGSEPPKNERYISTLYEIINARQSRLLPMIVNTNLKGDEIRERYSERICSRLLSMEVLLFYGNDYRLNNTL